MFVLVCRSFWARICLKVLLIYIVRVYYFSKSIKIAYRTLPQIDIHGMKSRYSLYTALLNSLDMIPSIVSLIAIFYALFRPVHLRLHLIYNIHLIFCHIDALRVARPKPNISMSWLGVIFLLLFYTKMAFMSAVEP